MVGSIVSVHCAMLCILCTYCAMLYIHILCTLAHSGTLGWLGGIMVSSTQTHPSRQFNFTLTNTPLDALCSRQKEYTMHMLLVECGLAVAVRCSLLSLGDRCCCCCCPLLLFVARCSLLWIGARCYSVLVVRCP